MLYLICVLPNGRVHIHTFNDCLSRAAFIDNAAELGYVSVVECNGSYELHEFAGE